MRTNGCLPKNELSCVPKLAVKSTIAIMPRDEVEVYESDFVLVVADVPFL